MYKNLIIHCKQSFFSHKKNQFNEAIWKQSIKKRILDIFALELLLPLHVVRDQINEINLLDMRTNAFAILIEILNLIKQTIVRSFVRRTVVW